MAYIPRDQLETMGFRSLGRDVRISDRAALYDVEQISIGDHSRIDDFCLLSGAITIGRNVHIAAYCNLAGGEKGITMADFAGLAYGCHVFTQSDDYTGRTMTNPTVPDAYKRESKRAIVIGRHTIVGTGSMVFPGADLAEGTAVGAMTMITKPTEEWLVYFGCPAKRLRARKRDLLAREAEYLASPEA